jgi:hypothetical protein
LIDVAQLHRHVKVVEHETRRYWQKGFQPLGCEHQIRDRATLLELFDAARSAVANPFWEARHVNGTGFAATTHSGSMNAASDLGQH